MNSNHFPATDDLLQDSMRAARETLAASKGQFIIITDGQNLRPIVRRQHLVSVLHSILKGASDQHLGNRIVEQEREAAAETFLQTEVSCVVFGISSRVIDLVNVSVLRKRSQSLGNAALEARIRNGDPRGLGLWRIDIGQKKVSQGQILGVDLIYRWKDRAAATDNTVSHLPKVFRAGGKTPGQAPLHVKAKRLNPITLVV